MAEDPSVTDDYMPFVVIHSVGGKYDDNAFTAGWQCGEIDGLLCPRLHNELNYLIFPDLMRQVDLVAMGHGYEVKVLSSDSEYVNVKFTRIDDWEGD